MTTSPNHAVAQDEELREVEMLQCFEDHRWGTLIVPVPLRLGEDREQVTCYVEEHYCRQCQYRRVVAWQVASLRPGATSG